MVRWCVALVLMMAAVSDVRAEEIREFYNDAGSITRRLVFRDGRLEVESTWRYDASGRPIEERDVQGDDIHLKRWEYTPSGQKAREEEWHNETLVKRSTWVYTKGRPTSMTVETDEHEPWVTYYHYDPLGRLILEETTDAFGKLLSRTIAERARPLTPIELTVSTGAALLTETQTLNANIGFEARRKPSMERYGFDPLEVRAGGSYSYSQAKGIVVSDALQGDFGIDYNYILPATSLFLFVNLERNPVANLDLDLELAPLGIKYDLIPRTAYLLNISFAPLWSYRAIPDSTALLYRGSFRLKGRYENERFMIKDMVEYLPLLGPGVESIADSLVADAIVRNTLIFSLQLTNRISVRQTFKAVFDQRLKEQGENCHGPDAELLCQGRSFSSTTALSFTLKAMR